MATTGRNNIVRSVNPKSLFESAYPVLSKTLSTWNEGDLLAFDATNACIIAVTGTGSGANSLGVAVQTVQNGIVPSPYQGTAVDASQGLSDIEGPQYGVVCSMILHTGDSFNPGQKVYISSDAQTVTSTAAGTSIGIFQGSPVTSAPSGTLGDVLIGANYGSSVTQF